MTMRKTEKEKNVRKTNEMEENAKTVERTEMHDSIGKPIMFYIN